MGTDEVRDPQRGHKLTVFIDTAVIMYAAGDKHSLREPCRTILRQVASGGLEAVTSAEVIQEIFHRFSALRRLSVGAEMARGTLDLFAPVLPVTHAVMLRMPALIERHADLSARDLVHIATCMEEGIHTMITPDKGLARTGEVSVFAPDDREAISSLVRRPSQGGRGGPDR
ncbi:MAG: type II toxin-antitoxin system VapC family toxin [Actinobacteria bacterium]|nr:type II toxin-antitoxin system VapC family toxin [Actinomycetota bacterium]